MPLCVTDYITAPLRDVVVGGGSWLGLVNSETFGQEHDILIRISSARLRCSHTRCMDADECLDQNSDQNSLDTSAWLFIRDICAYAPSARVLYFVLIEDMGRLGLGWVRWGSARINLVLPGEAQSSLLSYRD